MASVLITISLERYCYSDKATLGKLKTPAMDLYTIERPWQQNKKNVSCIPEGTYLCKRYSSEKYPDTFEVTGVAGRSYIVFHAANHAKELEGCIAPGLTQGQCFSVHQSKDAMKIFMDQLEAAEEFLLHVTQFRPGY